MAQCRKLFFKNAIWIVRFDISENYIFVNRLKDECDEWFTVTIYEPAFQFETEIDFIIPSASPCQIICPIKFLITILSPANKFDIVNSSVAGLGKMLNSGIGLAISKLVIEEKFLYEPQTWFPLW